jgi:ribosomal protein S8
MAQAPLRKRLDYQQEGMPVVAARQAVSSTGRETHDTASHAIVSQ